MQLDYITTHTSLSPIRRGFAPGFANHKNCLPVSQLLAHGRWFSPGIPGSSTTITGRHEMLLKVALNTKNQSINLFYVNINTHLRHTVSCLFDIFFNEILLLFSIQINKKYYFQFSDSLNHHSLKKINIRMKSFS